MLQHVSQPQGLWCDHIRLRPLLTPQRNRRLVFPQRTERLPQSASDGDKNTYLYGNDAGCCSKGSHVQQRRRSGNVSAVHSDAKPSKIHPTLRKVQDKEKKVNLQHSGNVKQNGTNRFFSCSRVGGLKKKENPCFVFLCFGRCWDFYCVGTMGPKLVTMTPERECPPTPQPRQTEEGKH